MKKIITLLLIILAGKQSFPQNWEWAIREKAVKMTVSADGSIYTATENKIKKLSSSSTMLWEIPFSGDLQIVSLVSNTAGDLFLTGSYTSFTLSGNTYVSDSATGLFLAKITSAGLVEWHKSYSGSGAITPADLCIAAGNIELAGNASAGTAVEAMSFTSDRLFVISYDNDGSVLAQFDHKGGFIQEISADAAGALYFIADIIQTDTLDFGAAGIYYGCGEGCPGEHLLAKSDNKGNIAWSTFLGSNYYQPNKNLCTDDSGNCYVSLWQRYDGFKISKFSPAGTLLWYNHLGDVYGDCQAICVTPDQSVWLTGYLCSGDGSHNRYLWNISSDNVVLNLDSGVVSGSGSQIAADAAGNIIVAGSFRGHAFFGSFDLYSETDDNFISKLSMTQPTDVAMQKDETGMMIYPNPAWRTATLQFDNLPENKTVLIYDLAGKLISEKVYKAEEDSTIELTGLSTGIYNIVVITGNKRRSQKLVLE